MRLAFLVKNHISMKYIASKSNKNILFKGLFLLLFTLVSSTAVVAQTSTSIVIESTVEVTPETKVQSVSTFSSSSNNMNFVLWFMGSKQDPNSTISTEGINTKKQVITSGTAPNRLLIKAFLKKAVELDSMLA